jgi:hypothetical protein
MIAPWNRRRRGFDPLLRKSRKTIFLEKVDRVLPGPSLMGLIQPTARGAHQALGGWPPFAVELCCASQRAVMMELQRSGHGLRFSSRRATLLPSWQSTGLSKLARSKLAIEVAVPTRCRRIFY